MAPSDVSSHLWLADPQASMLGVAGCITAVVGHTESGVLDAFGADVEQGPVYDADEAFSQFSVSTFPAALGVLALEINGFEGSRVEVLRAASKNGKAASIFWNVNGMIIFGCARRGQMLCSLELQPGAAEDQDVPRSLLPLLRLLDTDDVDAVAVGAAMVEKFTGVQVPRESTAVLDQAYAVHPRLADLYPASPSNSGLLRIRRQLVDVIVAADPATTRALAEWAATQAGRQTLLLDDPRLTSMTAQFGQSQPCSLTPDFVQLLGDVGRADDTIRSQDPSRHGGPATLRMRRASEKVWALRAFRHLTFADHTAAALGAVDCARHSMAVDGVGGQFLDEIERLLTIDPQRWPAEARSTPQPPTAEEREAAIEWERTQPERDAAQARARWEAMRSTRRNLRATTVGPQPPSASIAPGGTARGMTSRIYILSSVETDTRPQLLLGQPPRVGFVSASGDVVVWRGGQPTVLARLGASDSRAWAREAAGGIVIDRGAAMTWVPFDGQIDTQLTSRPVGRPMLNEDGTQLAVGRSGPGARWQLLVINLSDGSTIAMPTSGPTRPVRAVGFHDGAVYLADVHGASGASRSLRWVPGSAPQQLDYQVLQVDPATGTVHARDNEPGTFVIRGGERRRLSVPGTPILAPGGRYLYTTRHSPPTVTVYDLTAHESPRAHVLPPGSRAETVSPLQPVWEDSTHLLILNEHGREPAPVIRLNVETGHQEGVPLTAEAGYRPTLIVPLPGRP